MALLKSGRCGRRMCRGVRACHRRSSAPRMDTSRVGATCAPALGTSSMVGRRGGRRCSPLCEPARHQRRDPRRSPRHNRAKTVANTKTDSVCRSREVCVSVIEVANLQRSTERVLVFGVGLHVKSRPCAASTSRLNGASCSDCSVPTGPARLEHQQPP